MTWAERLDPDEPHPLWGEHRARYRFATQWAAGVRVLDAACGNGYGSAMLSQARPTQVIGIDLSREAISYASSRFGSARVRFVEADLEGLPFPARSFDLVTSFETIEHVPNPEGVTRELVRVLRPGGLLVVSTPNAALHAGGHSGNPYHIKEFTARELQRLIGDLVGTRILGQRLRRIGGGVLDYSGGTTKLEASADGSFVVFRRRLFSWLPLTLKELLWKRLRGESYYPEETEFDFVEERAERYPVLVALGRRG